MWLKADFHAHSGEDVKDLITYQTAELIDCAAEKGFEVMAVTNHDLHFQNSGLAEYAGEKGILLIPGIEATIEGKHVVILNTSEDVAAVRTFADLREYRKKHPEIFVIAPHPYYPNLRRHSLQKKLEQNIDVFDAVEYCHYYTSFFNLFNRMATKMAENHRKPLVGTSDAHHLFQVGKTYSLVEAEKNLPSILAALRAGKVKIESTPLSSLTFIRSVILFALKYFIKRIRKLWWHYSRRHDSHGSDR